MYRHATDAEVWPGVRNACVSIPGYREAQPVEVVDGGREIEGLRPDVFFPSHEQARQWGVRWLAVTIHPG